LDGETKKGKEKHGKKNIERNEFQEVRGSRMTVQKTVEAKQRLLTAVKGCKKETKREEIRGSCKGEEKTFKELAHSIASRPRSAGAIPLQLKKLSNAKKNRGNN